MSEKTSEKMIIGVIGMDEHGPEEPIPPNASEAAEIVGRLIAERGAILMTGGRGGIMETASRGCALAGGVSVGILPSKSKAEANPYVTIPIATGLREMRSHVMINACDAIIMICGSAGTLNEATLVYYEKPLVVLEGTGGWADRLRQTLIEGRYFDLRGSSEIFFVSTPEEAVSMAFDLAASSTAEGDTE